MVSDLMLFLSRADALSLSGGWIVVDLSFGLGFCFGLFLFFFFLGLDQ